MAGNGPRKEEKHAVKVTCCPSMAGEGHDKPRCRAPVFGFQFCHWVTLGKSRGPLFTVILHAPYRFVAKAKGHVT